MKVSLYSDFCSVSLFLLASRAIQGLDSPSSTAMHVQYNQKNMQPTLTPKNKLFVRGLPPGLDEEKSKAILEQYFQTFGKIYSIQILRRGCAIVKYEQLADAKRAVEIINMSKTSGSGAPSLPLQVSFSESSEEREKRVCISFFEYSTCSDIPFFI